jgi:hypothetical protein
MWQEMKGTRNVSSLLSRRENACFLACIYIYIYCYMDLFRYFCSSTEGVSRQIVHETVIILKLMNFFAKC